MIIILEKKNKIAEELINQLNSLENGKYLISIKPIGQRTVKDCKAHYFALVDTVRHFTGDDRYSIHENFKNHQGIESTKNFDINDWEKFIANFKWYVFEKLDLTI